MSNIQENKKKISSTKSTLKITKAMEMISAAKLKKLEQTNANSQSYLELLRKILLTTKAELKEDSSEDLKGVKNNKALLIVIGIDKGLVGGLKSKLILKTAKEVEEVQKRGMQIKVATLKKKTGELLSSYGIKVDFNFSLSEDNLEIESVKKIIFGNEITEKFEEVYLIYPKYINAFEQNIEIEKILPFNDQESGNTNFSIEIEGEDFIERLFAEYLESQLNYFMVNASLSENSARMVAMKKASENSKEIIKSQQLIFNKERQNKITQQIQETIRFKSN